MILVICDHFTMFHIWLRSPTHFQKALPYIFNHYHKSQPSRSHIMKVLCHFQNTFVFSFLPDDLLYGLTHIFTEIITYSCQLQRDAMRYHQGFKKEIC